MFHNEIEVQQDPCQKNNHGTLCSQQYCAVNNANEDVIIECGQY